MQKINFQNLPSTTTPVNATNLNAMQTTVEDVFNGTEPMGNIKVDTVTTKNLFNINGDVNVKGNTGATELNLNTVSGNVLTSNLNGTLDHAVGQKFTNLNGKTITFSAKLYSKGNAEGGGIAIYNNNILANVVSTNYPEDYITITYTCTSDNIICGLISTNGTGAQFTDIQVEIGNTRTNWAEYQNLSPKQVAFEYYTPNPISSGGLDDLKNYIPTGAPKGMSLWDIGFSGAKYGAICMKADENYLSFILFSYDMTAKQYKKYVNEWTEVQL